MIVEVKTVLRTKALCWISNCPMWRRYMLSMVDTEILVIIVKRAFSGKKKMLEHCVFVGNTVFFYDQIQTCSLQIRMLMKHYYTTDDSLHSHFSTIWHFLISIQLFPDSFIYSSTCLNSLFLGIVCFASISLMPILASLFYLLFLRGQTTVVISFPNLVTDFVFCTLQYSVSNSVPSCFSFSTCIKWGVRRRSG